MGFKYLKGFIVGIIIALFSFPASAQTLEIGLFGGGSYYIGEMNPTIPFKNTKLAYGAIARFNVNRRWAFRLSYQRGGIVGVDNKTGRIEERDFGFSGTINDISAIAEFNFFEYFTGSNKNFFTPYLFVGVSYTLENYKPIDPVDDLLEEGIIHSMAIPFGIGIKYSVSERIGLGLEWGMRKAFTDYIDGVNSLEYQTGILAKEKTDPTGQDENSTGDWYSFAGITVTYKINLRSRLKCNLEGW